MKINEEKLKKICNEHILTVPFNGISVFEHRIIDISKVLARLYEVCEDELTEEEFISEINKKPKPKLINDLFENIKTQGVFKMFGHERLESEYYVECKKLNWLE